MLTAATLGDQPIDPGFAHDVATLVSGVTQDLFYACWSRSDCRAGGHVDTNKPGWENDPWWAALRNSHGRITHRIGHDELRPRDFWAAGADRNMEALVDLIGWPNVQMDSQGLVATTITHGTYENAKPLVQQWLDDGPAAPPRTRWKAVGLFGLVAAGLGIAAARYTTH